MKGVELEVVEKKMEVVMVGEFVILEVVAEMIVMMVVEGLGLP